MRARVSWPARSSTSTLWTFLPSGTPGRNWKGPADCHGSFKLLWRPWMQTCASWPFGNHCPLSYGPAVFCVSSRFASSVVYPDLCEMYVLLMCDIRFYWLICSRVLLAISLLLFNPSFVCLCLSGSPLILCYFDTSFLQWHLGNYSLLSVLLTFFESYPFSLAK